MGYSTDYLGAFALDRPLVPEHRAYLVRLNRTRRVRRDAGKVSLLSDPCRLAAGLPVGEWAGYFVGGDGFLGQADDEGTHLGWDGGEKFYHDAAWLTYLIEHFLGPWSYLVSGVVRYRGGSDDDRAAIVVNPDQMVSRLPGSRKRPTDREVLWQPSVIYGRGRLERVKAHA